MKNIDKIELRSDFESVLKRGNREKIESLRRVLSRCKWNIMLRDNGFKIRHEGAITRIIPPAKPNPTARMMVKTMKEHRDRITRRFFGPVPPVARV